VPHHVIDVDVDVDVDVDGGAHMDMSEIKRFVSHKHTQPLTSIQHSVPLPHTHTLSHPLTH